MKKIFLFVLAFLVLSAISCELLIPCKDTKFTFQREENNTHQLKLGGYYYGEWYGDSNNVYVFVLYQNGIFCNNLSKNKEEAIAGEIELFSSTTSKPFIGIYRIVNDSIEIQEWKPELGWCSGAEVFKGIILNDSIFKITFQAEIRKRGDFKGEIERNVVFKFRSYSPKPDSVVSFIP